MLRSQEYRCFPAFNDNKPLEYAKLKPLTWQSVNLMTERISDDVIVVHSWLWGCLGAGTGGSGLNGTPTQFLRGGEETDRLRIEDIWPRTASLLWRATLLRPSVLIPYFLVLPWPSVKLCGSWLHFYFCGQFGPFTSDEVGHNTWFVSLGSATWCCMLYCIVVSIACLLSL